MELELEFFDDLLEEDALMTELEEGMSDYGTFESETEIEESLVTKFKNGVVDNVASFKNWVVPKL